MTNAPLPDWALLMRRWLDDGMGNTGVTLPFLAGALALRRGENRVPASALTVLIQTMVSIPVPGHFVGVRRCANIQAPVLSHLSLDDPLIRECETTSPSGQVALAFSPDAVSSLGGLDCDCASDCIRRLIEYSVPFTEAGNFSRVYDEKSQRFIYTTFRAREIEFIRRVLGSPS